VTIQANQKFLFIVHTPTFLTELSVFSAYLKKYKNARVVYLLLYDQKYSEKFISKCGSNGYELLTIDKTIKELDITFFNLVRFFGRRIYEMIRTYYYFSASFFFDINKEYLREMIELMKSRLLIQFILKKEKPDFIILGGDMPGYDSSLYIREAKKIGIESFIIPSTMSNGQEQAEVYSGDKQYHIRKQDIHFLKIFFKKWIKDYKGINLLRVPLARLFAFKSIGINYKEPWVFNSSNAKKIFIESISMYEYYRKAGLKNNNLVITGSPSNDIMTQIFNNNNNLATNLHNKYNIEKSKKKILFALPPDFYYVNGGRPQSIFNNYKECIDYFLDFIEQKNQVKWYMTLHPSMNRSDYKAFEDIGVTILSDPAYMLLPLVDIFIASVSSTIRWAIACGVPTINFDFYLYKYDDFMNQDGVLYADNKNSFNDIMNKLISDAEYYTCIRKKQSISSLKWGKLDDMCCVRIYDEITTSK
jgi:hypothetical protein